MKRNLRTRGRAIAVAVALAAGATGCSVASPFQTAQTQSIADGVTAEDLEGANADNLALVGVGEGGAVTVTGTVENPNPEEVTFTITAGGSKASTTVAPYTLTTLGEEDMTLEGIEDPEGAMTSVEVTAGGNTIPLDIPIVPPTHYYEEFEPEGYTPPPSPSEDEGGEDH